LGRVDDTVGVSAFDRIALEEAFVDSIQKVLTFKPAINTPGSALYGYVKAVKRL